MQILVSVWLIYHLLTVLAVPNTNALPARVLDPITLPYVNSLGLNTGWTFFSPGPAPQMYLEYEVQKHADSAAENHDAEAVPEVWQWPEAVRKEHLFMNYRRLVYFLRFLVLDPARLERVFVPYICGRHPGARELHMQHVWYEIPHIQKIISTDVKGDIRKRMAAEYSFKCPGQETNP